MEFLDEIEEKFINIDGLKLHTVIIGEGEPMVLVHDFPDFWYVWKHVIPRMKDDFKLIIPDTRGISLSDQSSLKAWNTMFKI